VPEQVQVEPARLAVKPKPDKIFRKFARDLVPGNMDNKDKELIRIWEKR
jgi:hypothetical protein